MTDHVLHLPTCPAAISWSAPPPRPAPSLRLPRPVRGEARRRAPPRDQCLGRGPSRRQGGDPHRPLRDGAGHADRPRPARRRGTECDWAKVTTEYPTPGQNVARNRVWGNFSTGGSRGIRESHDYVRKGGAAARMMLIQAAANEWNVPAAECSAEKSVITHKAPAARRAMARSPRRPRSSSAEGRRAQGSEGLDDRRQAAEAARHRRQDERQADLRHGSEDAGNAQRRDQGLPGLRRQGEELRRRRRAGNAGRQACRAGGRQRRRRRRRNLVAGEDGARCAADRVGRGRECQGLEREHGAPGSRKASTRPKPSSATRTATRRRRSPMPRRTIEAVYSYPFQNHATMEPMNATARYTPERCEVWTPTQNGEAALAAASEARACRSPNARPTRSISAAASAGAARCTTGCARSSPSPSRFPARR